VRHPLRIVPSAPQPQRQTGKPANFFAAFSVRAWRVCPGFRLSGSLKTAFSVARWYASRSSSMPIRRTSWTVFVQLVWISNVSMSQTTSSGGFSSATAYCCSWA
jgi:hypothetical protein